MDNVDIVVADFDAAIEFLVEFGLELEGRAPIAGDWSEGLTGLSGMRVQIVRLKSPDSHSRRGLSRFEAPTVVADRRRAPVNALGYLRVMFNVDDIDDTLPRLQPRGATLISPVVQCETSYRLCYVRGPEGILVGLVEQLEWTEERASPM